ncbi:hypothetical protein [Paracoccus siganidrum]|uniref:hypothetical protein n=1 Tax=Paracoccus siganidrum TaxID=1276757 RepID=UPI0011C4305D|nr:hypothetical protein [Paracoccus siganidrum]
MLVFRDAGAKRFAHVDPRQKATRTLWTDSERAARIKAAAVEAEVMAYWEALAAGQADDAAAAYEAARELAQPRGFPCRPAAELAAGSIDNLLTRLEALIRSDGTFAPLAEASALLGVMDKPRLDHGGAGRVREFRGHRAAGGQIRAADQTLASAARARRLDLREAEWRPCHD